MLWETLRLAVQAIFRNTMRSFLTVLGIVIGVAAVIAMVTVGQGSQEKVTQDVESLGSNALMVMPGAGGMRNGGFTSDRPFKKDDADAIEDLTVVRVAAPYSMSAMAVIYDGENHFTSIIGANGDMSDAMEWPVEIGRPFSDAEERGGRAVCLIGVTIREELFGNRAPVGEEIRVKNMACEVIGILEEKGVSSLGEDQDDIVVIPLLTYQRRIAGNDDVALIYLSVRDGVSMERATQDIEALLRDRRRISSGEEDDFSVMDMAQLASILTGITAVLAGLLSSVAAVSLLVGGIGIMNIMLVSVTERTREIGIRLAVGATAGQVLLQFLVEAMVLSLLGGALGILLGLSLAAFAAHLMAIPFSPDLFIVVLAFGFSAGVGVIFGFFPARRAARMDPIEALRHQ
ncbi:TRAP-type C4-dicarboxylate transport system periplasmic component-like protein [Actibacterium atlanticum]|uniref:TRAP-type C4-dicarboxylate transport system periplasmic component-like protein n=1 Tax=Actibacterium atlanticum TaxID=1461693 RepID=A0A058ZPV5_9RHOB|nr:ABC transporter permease [Actibacterium atlanticum]KCV83235.1 TRAP-type C4-dicarboxylate transport system periplasmic component-like protein [Actibacterium atlanticum]